MLHKLNGCISCMVIRKQYNSFSSTLHKNCYGASHRSYAIGVHICDVGETVVTVCGVITRGYHVHY